MRSSGPCGLSPRPPPSEAPPRALSFSQSPATRILAGHEIIAEDVVMSGETLRAVVMPARDKFAPDDRRGGPEVR